MRQVVVAEYLSLDGVSEDPGRIGTLDRRGWIVPYFDEEMAAVMADQLAEADALLLGRRTYEGFLQVWPGRSEDPIGDRMNSLPKFVASTTLRAPLEWNATLLDGEVGDEVRNLKDQPARNLLVYGSGELVRTLLELGLVDGLQLMVVPVLLGGGKRFFAEGGEPTSMALTDVKTTGAGVVVLTYRRVADRLMNAEPAVGDWFLNRPATRD
jgi:dihydrofolate reductase